MADVEQEQSDTADFERLKLPCQALQLAGCVEEALSAPFIVKAFVDGRALTATAQTAKDAFASAIEWHVMGNLTDVSISDRTRSYSIVEFASVMALAEIEHTIRAYVLRANFWKHWRLRSSCMEASG
jgi:hypothetical protein